MITKQIERNMPRLKELMAYSDAHSTPEQHDQIVNILAECVLELLGVLPDRNRRMDYLHNIHAQRRKALERSDANAAAWYRTYERMVSAYFESFQPFPLSPNTFGLDDRDEPLDQITGKVDPDDPPTAWGVYWKPGSN